MKNTFGQELMRLRRMVLLANTHQLPSEFRASELGAACNLGKYLSRKVLFMHCQDGVVEDALFLFNSEVENLYGCEGVRGEDANLLCSVLSGLEWLDKSIVRLGLLDANIPHYK
jgi:hypothetical protein